MTKTGTKTVPASTRGKLETATIYHLMYSLDTKPCAYINIVYRQRNQGHACETSIHDNSDA